MGVNGIYGLSGSGLDVESMVKVGMLSKQNEYDKMQQKYTSNEWKKSEFLNVYGELQTFNNSTLSQYKLSSNMNARTASSSNSSAVSATANANAALMTHRVSVSALASNAYLLGTDMKRENDNAENQNKLSSILFRSIERTNGVDRIAVNGDTTNTYNANDTAIFFSIDDGVNNVPTSSNPNAVTATAAVDAATGTYTVDITQVAESPKPLGANISTVFQGLDVSPTDTLSATLNQLATTDALQSALTQYLNNMPTDTNPTAVSFEVSDGINSVATVSYNYKEFKDLLTGDKTFKDFIESINNQLTGTNVKATLDDAGNIAFSNSVTGASSQLQIAMDFNKAVGGLTEFRSIMDPQGNHTGNPYADGNKFDAVASGLIFSMLMGTNNLNARMSQLQRDGADIDLNATLSDNTTRAVSITFSGTNAQGTITNPDGTTTTINEQSNTFTANNITYTATATGTADIANLGSQNIKITYGELSDGFTLNELASKINSLGGNVKATYDTVQDRFSIYNKESGATNQLNISIAKNTNAVNLDNDNTNDVAVDIGNNTAKLFNAFALKQSINGEFTEDTRDTPLNFDAGATKNRKGANGKVTIDGLEYNDIESNKTTVNGVTYNFVNTTGSDTNIAVTVTQDTAAIADKVKSFVSDYNALMTKLYKWYDEKPNSDYKPLTASQKDAMKEEQIEKWEEKAKAGMLYHDKTLGKVITDLRSAVSEKVEGVNGKYNTIFSVGISTTGLKGQLTLDMDKLNAALAEDPDAVYNIFAKLDSGEKQYLVQNNATGQQFWTTNRNLDTTDYQYLDKTKTVERPSYNGVAQRLGDIFMNGMKSIKSVAGSSEAIADDSDLNNLMRELQTKMSNFKRMMAAFETRLYKKYDAMESSLALLGAQLNYVTGSFQ